MKLNTFIRAFLKIIANDMNPKEFYEKNVMYIPRIVCKDDFSINVQVNKCTASVSENGCRTYGENWLEVEWFFPNQPIDGEKYNSLDEDTTQSNGVVEIGLLDDLLEEHNGIDLEKTLEWNLYMV